MVLRRVGSFDRLNRELSEVGRFARSVPTSGVSHEVCATLDYLYDELKYLLDSEHSLLEGRFLGIDFDLFGVHVRSFYRSGAIHVKSFRMSENDKNLFRVLLLMIPTRYSSLKVVPKYAFLPEKSQGLSYYLEYNGVQAKEHMP